MTLLVAYELLTDTEATFTVTSTIIDPLYRSDASLAGFSPNETVTVLDLMYGTILPSGAEAAVSLAIFAAGSEEEFVRLMNEKAHGMGLTNTHFTNCSGLHDPDHYSTAVEMAMILDYTLQYEQCRQILSTYQYTTDPTNKHSDGVFMESTMFARMYGDEPDGVTILAGKTGYTPQAGHCLCSYAEDDITGERFILVTAGAEGKFEPVFDAITVYSEFTPDSPES
jgi:D-alanyl-D-alanine carboxypeptidase (penicillin-binding protein 5/6)